MDELAGVVNLYPWYGAARKELCRRMAGVGGESWGVSQFSDQAMYVGDRGSIAEIMHKGDGADYSDKGLEALLSSYIEEKKKEDAPVYERKVHVVGGDFFSQSEYEKVKKVEDNVLPVSSRRRVRVRKSMEMCQDWISARRHWRKFTLNKAILNRQGAFTAN